MNKGGQKDSDAQVSCIICNSREFKLARKSVVNLIVSLPKSIGQKKEKKSLRKSIHEGHEFKYAATLIICSMTSFMLYV